MAGDGQGARVLVIGCGFIGSHVVTELACQHRPPIVLTRSQPADELLPSIHAGDLHVGDAGDAEALERALEGVGHVVYCAGGLLPAHSQDDPELDAKLTLRPLRALLDALRSRPDVKLTYISSGGTVYGEPDELPVSESAPAKPHGSYGQLHMICEQEIELHRADHGLSARILRCSTVYGERQWPERGQGVITTFLHRIEHDREIDLYGGPTTIRDYVYVGDVAKVVVALLDREDGEVVLNVGSEEGTSLTDLLQLLAARVDRPVRVNEHGERDFDVAAIVLDTRRLRSLIEFVPTPLERGIERTHSWLAAQTLERV